NHFRSPEYTTPEDNLLERALWLRNPHCSPKCCREHSTCWLSAPSRPARPTATPSPTRSNNGRTTCCKSSTVPSTPHSTASRTAAGSHHFGGPLKTTERQSITA